MKNKLLAISLFLITTLAIQRGLFPLRRVTSDAMEPTLFSGQRFVLNKLASLYRPPRRGEIIAVRLEKGGPLLLRRVLALEGETVSIHPGRLTVNGQVQDEPYLSRRNGGETRNPAGHFGPYRIPPGHFFVLADNRGGGADSRRFGAVPLNVVAGVVFEGRRKEVRKQGSREVRKRREK